MSLKILFVYFCLIVCSQGSRFNLTEEARGKVALDAYKTSGNPPITVNVEKKQVIINNGILQVTFSNPEGRVIGIKFGGLDNLLLYSPKSRNLGGYWDVVWNQFDSREDDIADVLFPEGAEFNVTKADENQVELSFKWTWNPSLGGFPMNIDKRFIMLRGASGFYSYGIYEREKGWGSTKVDQIRSVYKLRVDKFQYMALSDEVQRIMPTTQDRENGQQLAYPEAVLLTNPSIAELKGQVDDKYQYSVDDIGNSVHGWISSDPKVGFWLITPSNEFRTGGPPKQDLTSHAGPTCLNMFHSTHYAGIDESMRFEEGEPWKKVYGPYFVYLNAISPEEDTRLLWDQAKEQLLKESQSWPYEFPVSEDFAKANQRGTVVGKLHVTERNAPPVIANNAWVGLAAPGDVGSWQREGKGYQFWTRTNSKGIFAIKGVRAGTYGLYAWVPGFVGEYKYEKDIIITAGKKSNVGNLNYVPPRNGPTLWEIGYPDRTAAEFFIPDPDKNLINPSYTKIERHKQYGLWDRYTDSYPQNDLVYKVGESNHTKHWFYAHVTRRTADNQYIPTTWQIIFPLKEVAPNTSYTLQIALASASGTELQVRFNSHDKSDKPDFTTRLIGRDNAIARHGIHGLYWLFTVDVPSSLLQPGSNTIFLTQSRGGTFSGHMYDYIRFEGPRSD